MAPRRHFLQGLTNIIRFNWHFYVLAGILVLASGSLAFFLPAPFPIFAYAIAGTIFFATLVSLAVSAWVYDFSSLYRLDWLKDFPFGQNFLINIHAGFDEISPALVKRFPQARLRVFDFYDPSKHTEISIKRARRHRQPYPGTETIDTDAPLPLATGSVGLCVLFLSAHEIRSISERTRFFRELHRCLQPSGQIIVVEHLRDLPNFLAYTFGFFHFLSHRTWLVTFAGAGLHLASEEKITPFLSIFTLTVRGNAP